MNEMDQVLKNLKYIIDNHPLDDWDRGWNAAIHFAIGQIEAVQQSAECAAPGCKNVGIYNIWLCSEHVHPENK